MGNDERRRLLGGYEIDVWEAKVYTKNAAARCLRYAKRVVARRERREGRAVTRSGWDQ